MDKKYSKEELLDILPGFSGTTQYYRYHTLFMTDGVKFLADAAECYWLVGVIWSVQQKISEHGMVICTLKVNEDRSASFVAVGDGEAIVHEQKIEWTDFPLDEIKLFVADDVVMLPSEY